MSTLLLPPYLASTSWAQRKLQPKSLTTRDYTRTVIESNNPDGMTLTVPIKGGASIVKRLKPTQVNISNHGDWTRIHLGAIEAAYGREPYFQHLFPEIASIITNYPENLAKMNVLLMTIMLDFVGYEKEIEKIETLRQTNPGRVSDIAKRLETKINTSHSFLEPLFRFGPESIFLL